MYQAASKDDHAFLQALASDSAVVEGLVSFLTSRRNECYDGLQRAAIAALDDKNSAPFALRQAGAVAVLDDVIFTLNSYAQRSKK